MVTKAIAKVFNTKTLTLSSHDQAPPHLKMKGISHGYRVGYNPLMCLQSLFIVHNQTGNIYTHGLAFIGFFMYYWVTHSDDLLTALAHISFNTDFLRGQTMQPLLLGSHVVSRKFVIDQLLLLLLFCGVQFMFLTSTLFHLFGCISARAYYTLNRLDGFGINAVFFSAFMYTIYYGFHCSPFWLEVHLGLHVVVSAVMMIVSSDNRFRHPEALLLRTFIYGLQFMCGVGAAVHCALLLGVTSPDGILFLTNLGYQALLAVIGAAFYTSRMPEKYYPGKFNNFFYSHQFWHLIIICGMALSFFTCLEFAAWRNDTCPVTD